MIEALDRLPHRSCVAGLASPPELTPVWIARRVATRAVLRAPAKIVAAVAPRTLHALVGPGQGKIGQSVIEGGRIESDQRIIPSLVVAVTALAVTTAGRAKLAVKLRSTGDIAGDAFVAREAFAVLRFLAKRTVAGFTVGLQLGVGIGQRSGRYQSFHDRLCGDRRCQAKA